MVNDKLVGLVSLIKEVRMTPEVIAALGAGVGALLGAIGGTLGGWLTSKHRTTGAIREKAISISQHVAENFDIRGTEACTASKYVSAVGGLVSYYIHTIEHAENKRLDSPNAADSWKGLEENLDALFELKLSGKSNEGSSETRDLFPES